MGQDQKVLLVSSTPCKGHALSRVLDRFLNRHEKDSHSGTCKSLYSMHCGEAPYPTSPSLSLDHLFCSAVWAPCLLAIGASLGLYAYWCVSASALFQRSASVRSPQMIRVRGLTHDQIKIGFLLFEGGYPRNIRQQIE